MISFITNIKRLLAKKPPSATKPSSGSKQQQPNPGGLGAHIVPRAEHNISRKHISSNACKVLYRLKQSGFQAYLVGGCVRDLLLNAAPKDFDIATDARPEQVRDIFSNCRLIGRRFRLAHVFFGRDIVEVATFRATADEALVEQHIVKTNHVGMLVRDNAYGTIEQDVIRRDFTINALYYNIADFSLVDYVGGLEDIAKRQLRVIGDPAARYREDPVRMLRAVRFACKLNFTIHQDAEAPIYTLANLIANVAPGRLYEEYVKLFFIGYATTVFNRLVEYKLYQEMFPQVNLVGSELEMINQALVDTDERVLNGKTVSPGFLIAVFLWEAFYQEYELIRQQGNNYYESCQQAAAVVLSRQIKTVSLPRYFSTMIKEIWLLQIKLRNHNVKTVKQIWQHERFRACYDFLLLRAKVADTQDIQKTENLIATAAWWQTFVDADADRKNGLLAELDNKTKHQRNRGNRKRKPNEQKFKNES